MVLQAKVAATLPDTIKPHPHTPEDTEPEEEHLLPQPRPEEILRETEEEVSAHEEDYRLKDEDGVDADVMDSNERRSDEVYAADEMMPTERSQEILLDDKIQLELLISHALHLPLLSTPLGQGKSTHTLYIIAQ